MIGKLIKELTQLTIEEKYNYRFVNMIESIVCAWRRGDVEQLNTLTNNAEKLLEEYRRSLLQEYGS